MLTTLVSSCAAHFIGGSTGPGPDVELNFDFAQSAHGGDRRYDTAYGDGNLVQRLHHKCKRQCYLEFLGSPDG